jgi:hypothetical protein
MFSIFSKKNDALKKKRRTKTTINGGTHKYIYNSIPDYLNGLYLKLYY